MYDKGVSYSSFNQGVQLDEEGPVAIDPKTGKKLRWQSDLRDQLLHGFIDRC